MQIFAFLERSNSVVAPEPSSAELERIANFLFLDEATNADERGMGAVALGRKNYLFVGPEAGGKAAAITHTPIETAKLNAVAPHAWLAGTLGRIPDYKITKVDDLLPWRWSQ
jgi:hypothetical protein